MIIVFIFFAKKSVCAFVLLGVIQLQTAEFTRTKSIMMLIYYTHPLQL